MPIYKSLGEVTAQQQSTTYTCSAVALSAVLRHWGVTVSETTLSSEIGAEPRYGATAPQIVTAAQRYGFVGDVRAFRSLTELDSYVGHMRRVTRRPILPVIANIFSFTRPDSGHFVVITDVNATHVELMDPNAPTNWRLLTHEQMARRWFSRGGVGVVIYPP